MFKSIFICTFFIAWLSKDMELAQGHLVVKLVTVTPKEKYTNYITIQPNSEGYYNLSDATNFSSPKDYTNFINQLTPKYANSKEQPTWINITLCNFSCDGIDDERFAVPERFQLEVAPKCEMRCCT